ncbi:DUF7342 family protein [Natronorarus salvus]|uniref:DUF7342 family protein n=1 Tax=Natronorarus salvus TaxID=3117733 RepID=UPI002F26D41E
MSSFGPAPSDSTIEDEVADWKQTHGTRQRVKQVLAGVRTPLAASDVAEQAHCTTKSARKYLEELVDERIARKIEDSRGARYLRNEEYHRWRRADALSTEYSESELLTALDRLEQRDADYRDRFEVSTPDAVEFPPDDATHDEIHDLWETLTDWESVREEMHLHREALRIARHRTDTPLSA